MRTFARGLIVLLAALLTTVTLARADLIAVQVSALAFTRAENDVIARNQLLASVVDQEPQVVRRVLDALASLDSQPRPRMQPSTAAPPSGRLPKIPGGEPSKNPDLERLDRASPEALNDLFQLLKRVGQRPR